MGGWVGGSERDDREEVREEGERGERSVGSLRRIGGLEVESEVYVSENRNGSGVSDADSEPGAGIFEADQQPKDSVGRPKTIPSESLSDSSTNSRASIQSTDPKLPSPAPSSTLTLKNFSPPPSQTPPLSQNSKSTHITDPNPISTPQSTLYHTPSLQSLQNSTQSSKPPHSDPNPPQFSHQIFKKSENSPQISTQSLINPYMTQKNHS